MLAPRRNFFAPPPGHWASEELRQLRSMFPSRSYKFIWDGRRTLFKRFAYGVWGRWVPVYRAMRDSVDRRRRETFRARFTGRGRYRSRRGDDDEAVFWLRGVAARRAAGMVMDTEPARERMVAAQQPPVQGGAIDRNLAADFEAARASPRARSRSRDRR